MCRDFRDYAPVRVADLSAALRDRHTAQLREAAHRLCGLLSAFSTAARTVASELEEQAAGGIAGEAQPLVERLETMVHDVILELEGLSLETLRRRASTGGV